MSDYKQSLNMRTDLVKLKCILRALNEWDPINLFPLAPKDEYIREAEDISEYIINCNIHDIDALVEKIDSVFTSSFGNDIYKAKLEELYQVAKK